VQKFRIITPSNGDERGCQLSIQTFSGGKKIFKWLTDNGVIADWREPDVIRIAPVPLYNRFEEVYRFAQLFREALQ
jgi:kynureninase